MGMLRASFARRQLPVSCALIDHFVLHQSHAKDDNDSDDEARKRMTRSNWQAQLTYLYVIIFRRIVPGAILVLLVLNSAGIGQRHW